MKSLENKFDAPIPGMGMTAELGGRPWQSPAQYPTVETAVDYYITRMSSDQFADEVIDILEMGVPVSTLVDIIQTTGAMEGLHTIDVGILIAPVLMEFIMFLGDSAKIKYTIGTEDTDEPSKAMLSSALNKFKKAEEKKGIDEKIIDKEMDAPVIDEQPTGLMARRS
tara:strand:- start:157 stop:657 length:501 start_codon:yes stop_codon:yes gene_type:complete